MPGFEFHEAAIQISSLRIFHISTDPIIHLSGPFFVAGNQSVADADDATGMPGNIFLVRDDNDGVAFPEKFVKQRHDFRAGLGIEVARRLVGQQDGRFVDQRAGDGHALALAAGEFIGLVMNAVGQADLRQRLEGEAAAFLGGHARRKSAAIPHCAARSSAPAG